MNRLFVYLGRFAAITFGFICAALAASAFLHLLVLGGLIFPGEEIDAEYAFPLLLTIPFVSLVVGYWSFLPAFIFIVIAEVAAWRNWLSYALTGAAIALLAGFIGSARTDVDLALAFVAAGMVGGLAYWAAAGRHAGKWLDDTSEASQTPER